MKLRNKKTGEIGELKPFIVDERIAVWVDNKSHPEYRYKSLTELNAEWEDAPEESAKPYWFINDLDGEPMKCDLKNCGKSNFIEWGKHRKQIGNYFETKEEAKKAVEKLKAWKRLKDKGFRFEGWEMDGTIWFETKQDEQEWSPKYRDDLDLLFGGEE